MAVREDILPIISMGQSITGGALAGAAASAENDNVLPVLEDLRDISLRNEENTDTFVELLGMQFGFDKERFRRERDQKREQDKEKLRETGEGIQLPGIQEMTGGFGVKGLAALGALAFFMKEIGLMDLLRLPQQLKSVRSLTNFVKGLANIGTLGLGSKLADDARAAIKAIKVDPSKITKSVSTMFDDTFKGIANMLKGTPDNPSVFTRITNSFTKTLDTVKDSFTGIKTSITESKAFKSLSTFADDIATSIKKTFKPFKDAVMGIFGSGEAAGAAGQAGKASGTLRAIIEPLKAIGKTIGKIFLPLTIILGVFDGYKGFEEEYKDEKSILDGLRGSIKGIIDGFVGSFVSIIGSAFNLVLGFFGLDKTGELIGGEEGIANDIRTALNNTVGGLVDLITGLFSFDPKRVKEGLGSLLTGSIEWASLLFTPIDLAVNFIKDLFGIGDDNDEPFRFKDYLFGKDGIIGKAIAMIEDIFKIDFSAIGDKIFDMGRMLKAMIMASGSYTATYLNPLTKGSNAEAAAKAYEETYNEVMGTGTSQNAESTDMSGTAETIEKNIDMSKTETLNEGDTSTQGDIVIGSIDQSQKDYSQTAKKEEIAVGGLNVAIDPYWEAAHG